MVYMKRFTGMYGNIEEHDEGSFVYYKDAKVEVSWLETQLSIAQIKLSICEDRLDLLGGDD